MKNKFRLFLGLVSITFLVTGLVLAIFTHHLELGCGIGYTGAGWCLLFIISNKKK